jgi:ABC-type branched-subunit amino acid transport system substrate-binding protein
MRTLRSKDERVRFAVSAWAANHLLPELAGSAAEEALTEQYHDLFDQSPAYTHFAARYQERFQQRPDYAGVIAYEATNLVLDGLTIDPNRASLKTTLLKKANFDGLQGSIVLDRDGDATRRGYTAIIKGGRYAPLN